MNYPTSILSIASFVWTLGLLSLSAAENYQASLIAGDNFRKAKEIDKALEEYNTAANQAGSNTENALALAKQAEIFAFEKIDYVHARQLADKALAIQQARTVAQVSALRVLAQCQMKGEKDFPGAIATLEKALALQDVDWAIPMLQLALGDCYRNTGEFPKALEAYQVIIENAELSADVRGVAQLNTGLTYQYNILDGTKARTAYAEAVKLNARLKKEIDEHLAKL